MVGPLRCFSSDKDIDGGASSAATMAVDATAGRIGAAGTGWAGAQVVRLFPGREEDDNHADAITRATPGRNVFRTRCWPGMSEGTS